MIPNRDISETLRTIASFLLICFLLSSCSQTDLILQDTSTPTERPTVESSSTPTSAPTPTPSPTSLPSPTPLEIAGELAFVSDRTGSYQIFLVNADGTQLKQLTNSEGDNTSPTWFPDGSGLAFVSTRDGDREIYVMRSDGTDQTNFTNHPGEDHSPAWSPDGSAIAFVANLEGFDQVTVLEGDRTLRASLRSEVENTQTQFCCVVWYSERMVAFTRVEAGVGTIIAWDTPTGNTFISRTADELDSTDVSVISECCRVPSPVDDSYLFVSAESGLEQIYWWEGAEGPTVKLTDHHLGSFGPSWSSDGQWVAYYAEEGGNLEVFLIQPGDVEPVNLTNDPGDDTEPAWRP